MFLGLFLFVSKQTVRHFVIFASKCYEKIPLWDLTYVRLEPSSFALTFSKISNHRMVSAVLYSR